MKRDPNFAPEFKKGTRWWGRMALITWSIFFLFWGVLLALAWWSGHH